MVSMLCKAAECMNLCTLFASWWRLGAYYATMALLFCILVCDIRLPREVTAYIQHTWAIDLLVLTISPRFTSENIVCRRLCVSASIQNIRLWNLVACFWRVCWQYLIGKRRGFGFHEYRIAVLIWASSTAKLVPGRLRILLGRLFGQR